jgi:hypothetical protein
MGGKKNKNEEGKKLAYSGMSTTNIEKMMD